MPRRSELTVEQRREAVLALLRREEPAAQLARRYATARSLKTLTRRSGRLNYRNSLARNGLWRIFLKSGGY